MYQLQAGIADSVLQVVDINVGKSGKYYEGKKVRNKDFARSVVACGRRVRLPVTTITTPHAKTGYAVYY